MSYGERPLTRICNSCQRCERHCFDEADCRFSLRRESCLTCSGAVMSSSWRTWRWCGGLPEYRTASACCSSVPIACVASGVGGDLLNPSVTTATGQLPWWHGVPRRSVGHAQR